MDDSTLSNLENETLIENHPNSNSIASSPSGRYWLIFYLVVRLSPLILFFLSLFIFSFIPTFKILIITFSILCEFWLTKNKEGLELVGLRWSHEISESGGDPKWIFYSRPDPYVPDGSKLRCFWTVMYTMVVVWSIISLLSLITPGFRWVDTFLTFFATSCEYINLLCFLQCNQQTSKQQDDIARSVMLGDAFDSDKLEPEPEPESDVNLTAPPIIHTEKTVEKKRRDLENPRLTLPLRTNKASDPSEIMNNKSQNNDEMNLNINDNDQSISGDQEKIENNESENNHSDYE